MNVEPGIRINYQDGTTTVDNSQQIPVPFAADDEYEIDKSNETDGPIKATGHYTRPIADQPRQYYRSY